MRLRLADFAYTPDALIDAGLPVALRGPEQGYAIVKSGLCIGARRPPGLVVMHYVEPAQRALLASPAQAALLPAGVSISTTSRAAL